MCVCGVTFKEDGTFNDNEITRVELINLYFPTFSSTFQFPLLSLLSKYRKWRRRRGKTLSSSAFWPYRWTKLRGWGKTALCRTMTSLKSLFLRTSWFTNCWWRIACLWTLVSMQLWQASSRAMPGLLLKVSEGENKMMEHSGPLNVA